MLTDVTVMNEQIDFSKALPMNYEYSIAAIINAHFEIHSALWDLATQFFNDTFSSMNQILIIWCIITSFTVVLIELYVQKFVICDTVLVKSMLKFFPVSFAKESPGVKNFAAGVVGEQSII